MSANIKKLPIHGDSRGSLIAIEELKQTDFNIRRVYYIFGTQPDVRRGFHAHFDLKQMVICVSGSCKILLDNGIEQKHVIMDSPSKCLTIEGLIWREMYDFTPDCVLLVLADKLYDTSDYIRDYDAFRSEVKKRGRSEEIDTENIGNL